MGEFERVAIANSSNGAKKSENFLSFTSIYICVWIETIENLSAADRALFVNDKKRLQK